MPMTVSPIAIAGLIPVPPAHTCVGSTYLCRQYLRPCLRVPDRFDVYAQAPQYHRLSSFSCFVLCSPPALHCAAHVKILPIKCSPQSGVCSKESRRQRDQSPRVVYIMNSPRPPFPPHVAMRLQSLSVAPRQSHLRFCQPTSSCVLNADIFSSIIQLTDPTTVAQCRLVSPGDGICALLWVLFEVLSAFHSIFFPPLCSSLNMLGLHVFVSHLLYFLCITISGDERMRWRMWAESTCVDD